MGRKQGKHHYPVIPLVGPSSILLALIASGCNGQNFSFNGYLPVKENERAKALRHFEKQSAAENRTRRSESDSLFFVYNKNLPVEIRVFFASH